MAAALRKANPTLGDVAASGITHRGIFGKTDKELYALEGPWTED